MTFHDFFDWPKLLKNLSKQISFFLEILHISQTMQIEFLPVRFVLFVCSAFLQFFFISVFLYYSYLLIFLLMSLNKVNFYFPFFLMIKKKKQTEKIGLTYTFYSIDFSFIFHLNYNCWVYTRKNSGTIFFVLNLNLTLRKLQF